MLPQMLAADLRKRMLAGLRDNRHRNMQLSDGPFEICGLASPWEHQDDIGTAVFQHECVSFGLGMLAEEGPIGRISDHVYVVLASPAFGFDPDCRETAMDENGYRRCAQYIVEFPANDCRFGEVSAATDEKTHGDYSDSGS